LLKEEIHKVESKALIRSVFSLIALFTENCDRSKLNDSLENFRTMMEFYGRPKYDHDDSLAKWWVKGDGWKSDKIEAVVHSLKNRSFF